MEKNIKDLVKPIYKNGKVFTHQDTTEEEVSSYWCSTFIKKKNTLVKGERNSSFDDTSVAMIHLFDLETGDIAGSEGSAFVPISTKAGD